MWARAFFVTGDARPALLWRVAGYLIVFGLVVGTRGALTDWLLSRFAGLAGSLPLFLANSVVAAALIVATLSVTFVFRRFVDRRPWEGMACPAPRTRWRGVEFGAAIGVAMLLAIAGIEYFAGWFRIRGWKEETTAAAIAGLLSARLIYYFATAFCEELAYRGYLLSNLGERYPLWLAVFVTGALFGLSHFAAHGFNWRFVIAALLASYFLASLRLMTRTIWLGVGWHWGWDWGADMLGLVPGYSPLRTERLGPPLWTGEGLAIEGGLLVILLLAVALGGSLAVFRRSGLSWSARLTPQGELAARLQPVAASN